MPVMTVSGSAVRILAVRVHWQLKVFTAVDTGGAH